jgi:hypothetical protein
LPPLRIAVVAAEERSAAPDLYDFRYSKRYVRMSTFRTPGLNRLNRTHKVSISGVAAAGVAALTFSLIPGNASAGTEGRTTATAAVSAESPAKAHAAHVQAKAHAQAKANADARKKAAAEVAVDKRTKVQTASRAAARTPVYTDNLNGWINEALSIMKAEGIPGSYEGLHRNIIRESGGDPNAINNWDINAINGVPSIGLLQVIKPTFDAYHVEGTPHSQYDPVANLVAASNYAADRYGSIDNVDSAY